MPLAHATGDTAGSRQELPAGQGRQDTCAALSWYVPAAQTVGAAVKEGHCMPCGQSVHAVSPSRLYWPAVHAVVVAVAAAQLMPAGQGSHAVRAPFARRPVLHTVQVVLPGDENRPAAHAVAAVREQEEPAGQTVQLGTPLAENKPLLHAVQEDAPGEENSPALHGMPVLLPGPQRSPAGHKAQLELLALIDRRPAGQSVHVVAPTIEYLPATQGTGAATLVEQEAPAVQTVQFPPEKREKVIHNKFRRNDVTSNTGQKAESSLQFHPYELSVKPFDTINPNDKDSQDQLN